MDLKYRPDIDGLRGLAVLAVMLFHINAQYLPGGYNGVDVFFVISGFLIASQRNMGLLDFYSRRIRRIFPALLAMLLVVLAIGSIYLLPDELARLSRHALFSTFFAANFQFWREIGYFAPRADYIQLKHLWSLAVEEQFYLIFPVIMLLLSRRPKLILPFFAVVSAVSYWAFSKTVVELNPAGFYLLPYRAWELGAGVCLAYLPKKQWPDRIKIGFSWLGLFFIGYSLTQPVPSPWPVVGTVLVIAGQNSWLTKLSYVGLISYPLYLWHWPLMSFYRATHFAELPLTAAAIIVIVSFILAWATYEFIEKPIRYGRPSRIRVPALAFCMTGLALLAGLVWNFNGVPARYPAAIQGLVQYSTNIKAGTRSGQCWLSVDDKSPFHPDCLDESTDAKLVVLWGDSHAAMLFPGLLQAADKNKTRWGQFNRDSCPPLFGAGVEETLSEICLTSNKEVLARLSVAKPEIVFLFANWSMYPAAVSGLIETIGRLEKIGAKVVVLGPAPQWIDRLPRVLTNYYFENGGQPIPERTHYGVLPGILKLDEEMQSAFPGKYVSVADMLCNEQGCLNRFGPSFDFLESWDYGHLAPPAAEFVARRLVSQVN